MTRTDPGEAAGLVVIRLWVEPASEDAPDDLLRARITTAKDPDLGTEETFTVAGIDGVLTAVRAFLTNVRPSACSSSSQRSGTPSRSRKRQPG